MITLTNEEVAISEYIAKARTAYMKARKIINPGFSDYMSEYEMKAEGIAAEIAFCKFANIYPALNVGDLGQTDCILHGGQTVDVKATKYPEGKLIAPRWKKPESVDIYVLMVGEIPTFECMGWVRCWEFITPSNIIDLGKGPTYGLSQDKLNPPEQILFI